MTMTARDIDRLEELAIQQCGPLLGTPIALTPGEVMDLCRLARLGAEQQAPKEE